MIIFIRTLTGSIFALDAKSSNTITVIKGKIRDKQGIPTDRQRLVIGREELEDDRTLCDYNIKNESVIYLVLKL